MCYRVVFGRIKSFVKFLNFVEFCLSSGIFIFELIEFFQSLFNSIFLPSFNISSSPKYSIILTFFKPLNELSDLSFVLRMNYIPVKFMDGPYHLKLNQKYGEHNEVYGQSRRSYNAIVPENHHHILNELSHSVLKNINSSTLMLGHHHKHIHVIPFSIIYEVKIIILAFEGFGLEPQCFFCNYLYSVVHVGLIEIELPFSCDRL